MNEKSTLQTAGHTTEGWDTGSHQDFYEYYEQQSRSPKALDGFRSTCDTLLRLFELAGDARKLDVLDIGCGAGAQSKFWLERGHRYRGVDISEPLIQLARDRANQQNLDSRFDVGTATDLPCADSSMDICLLPELLEHVSDWKSCVEEAIRVLRPKGLIYINTSSKLCPRQEEFNLPLYSWYPGRLKRYFERRAVTDWPSVANFAKYPAVNWFSYYSLRDYLEPKGFSCMDRLDIIDARKKSSSARTVLSAVRALAPLRFLGHVITPYTLVVAWKH
ncbi:MAG: methyltransferase domain-containing protein [Gallionella sp.]|nr:methyltransferase domain-containing protein [Gallionella sp.]